MTPNISPDGVHRTVDAVWRMESARIVGTLARIVGDVGVAEDMAQDALVAALEAWPESGVPGNPGAWLMAVSKRRAIDHLRRERRMGQWRHAAAALEAIEAADAIEAGAENPLGDDVLRLVFLCCHPILSSEARVALTLRLVGGLGTEEVARAFLVPVSTLAQRIVRAKRTLREARVPFQLPAPEELSERLASVLEVVYLIFNEGYAATAGGDWVRPELCREALRLGRILAGLAPDEPEVHGLAALMELQASRLSARTNASGEPILLLDQDRARWDRHLIRRGLASLDRGFRGDGVLGPYTLQAAVAACHARASRAEETDWERIVALYDALAQIAPSPVVELNRAVAVSMAFGPEEALEIVDGLRFEASLETYSLLPAVRGDLLSKLGRHDEARAEFDRAASLTKNERERTLMRARREACGGRAQADR